MNKKKLKKILKCTPEKYDLEVYIEKHKEMKNGNFKHLSKKDMAIAILNEIDDKRFEYEWLLQDIYEIIVYIMHPEYYNVELPEEYDIYRFNECMSILNYLKNHNSTYLHYYINENSCQKVYNEKTYEKFKEYGISKEPEEIFNSDHLFDTEYYKEIFIERYKDNKEFAEFIKESIHYGCYF